MKKSRRIAGKVDCMGSVLTVVETDQDNELTDDKGILLNGFYQADHNLIVIDSRLPPDVKKEILDHELGHAVFEQSLFANKLAEICSPSAAEKFEEDMMTSFLPSYVETLRKNKVRFR